MRLRRRLVATFIIVVALGLAAVDIVTLSALHSYLYGRVDDQLATASSQIASFLARADAKQFPVTAASISDRVSPDIYFELVGTNGQTVARTASTDSEVSPPPEVPSPLPAESPSQVAAEAHALRKNRVYRPSAGSVDVPARGGHGPGYRLMGSSIDGRTLIVATSLDTVEGTLSSLRNIELAVSLGLLAVLLVLMTLLIRLGLRPLEGMARDADAIAAGDLARRVGETHGDGEIARLGRALNGMLEQIETAFAERARSEERLRSFLADASHELRTPLTSIRGYAELLQKGALEDADARERALARIEREAARMGLLVGDLSVLAREGEGPEPTRRRIDLRAVVADAVADAQTIDSTRRIRLRADGEVPVAGDDARLGQIIDNLLGNALTHTPRGTPVDVGVSVRGDRAVLLVQDHGPGMTAEQASHVFDRFYRGDAERLDGGSGLGLFIVASLARTFGGHAAVTTDVGHGATFEVELPVYGSATTSHAPAPRAAAPHTTAPHTTAPNPTRSNGGTGHDTGLD
jgi:two-component system, OmpR family, sensor kinase